MPAEPTQLSLSWLAGRRRLGCCGLGLLTLLLTPATLLANPLDLFGFGARGAAMGAMTAAADDYTAVYYNPGALGLAPSGMGAGLHASYDDVTIRLKPRPAGYDLPDLGAGGAVIGSKYRLRSRSDTNDIPNTYALHIGGVGSLGSERLRIGFAAFLPLNRLGQQSSPYSDEREQYFSNALQFEMIGQPAQHQVIMLAAAYRLTPWLSLGTGLSMMPQSTTQSQVYVPDPGHQDKINMTVTNDQVGRFAQLAGILLTPADHWQLGATWRGENYFAINLDTELQIKGFQNDPGSYPIHQRSQVVSAYQPHQFVVGASYVDDGLQFVADATYALWSRYRNHQGEQGSGFADTWSARVGAGWQVTPDRVLRAGLRWEPSPVPDQTGRTNYVDNDRVVASVGAGHRMHMFGHDMELGWYIQATHLMPRDTNKAVHGSYPTCAPGVSGLCDEAPDASIDPTTGHPVAAYQGLQTGNPGFPGFTSYGDVFAFGLDGRWAF